MTIHSPLGAILRAEVANARVVSWSLSTARQARRTDIGQRGRKGECCHQGIECRFRRPRGHWRWLEMCLRAEVGLPLQGHSCSVLCELLFSFIPIAALHPVYKVKKIPKHGVQRGALLPAPRGIFLAKPVRTAVPRCKATNRSARRLALEQVGTHAA